MVSAALLVWLDGELEARVHHVDGLVLRVFGEGPAAHAFEVAVWVVAAEEGGGGLAFTWWAGCGEVVDWCGVTATVGVGGGWRDRVVGLRPGGGRGGVGAYEKPAVEKGTAELEVYECCAEG